MRLTGRCHLVGKSATVVKSGERKGEVLHKISLSDGENTLSDILLSDEAEGIAFDNLKNFSEYDFVFDYSTRVFNDKAYNSFSVKGIFSPNQVKIEQPAK